MNGPAAGPTRSARATSPRSEDPPPSDSSALSAHAQATRSSRSNRRRPAANGAPSKNPVGNTSPTTQARRAGHGQLAAQSATRGTARDVHTAAPAAAAAPRLGDQPRRP